MAGHAHGPLKVLLAPLVAIFDALLGTVTVTLDGASLSLFGVSSLLPCIG
jgi:heme A synthase